MTTAAARQVTMILGAVYVLVGILGFVPGVVTATEQPGQGLLLGIFAVNMLHNLAHIVLGAVLVWGARAWDVILVNKGMAVVFALLTVVSVIAPNFESLPQNMPDTILHLVTTLVTAYIGFMTPAGDRMT